MSLEKPSWSAIVKADSFGKGVFSEEMKRTVMNRVEQNQRKSMQRSWLRIAVPLMILLICIFIIPLAERLRGVVQDEVVSATASSQANNDVILHYEPAKDLSVIPQTDKGIRGSVLKRLPLSSVQIKDATSFDGIGNYLDYTKPEDESDPIAYFGFQPSNQNGTADGEFYEIGYGKMSDVNMQLSDAFGFTHLRLDGKCGPVRRCAYWISVSQDQATAFEQTDALKIDEHDLDGDGVTEAIVQTYEGEIYIYKYIDGKIESVQVQAALKADNEDTVTYDPDQLVFVLNSRGEMKSYRYAAGPDRLVSVQDEGD